MQLKRQKHRNKCLVVDYIHLRYSLKYIQSFMYQIKMEPLLEREETEEEAGKSL